jgi:hypothetical protein
VLIAAALLLQAALIIALIHEHRRRRTLEVEIRQRMSELAHVNRQAPPVSFPHRWDELNQPPGAILAEPR